MPGVRRRAQAVRPSVTRRTVTALGGLGLVGSLRLTPGAVHAEHGCGDLGTLGAVLSVPGAFLASSVALASSAGLLAAGNEGRDVTSEGPARASSRPRASSKLALESAF